MTADAHAVALALCEWLIGEGQEPADAALLVNFSPRSVRAGALQATAIVVLAGRLPDEARQTWSRCLVGVLTAQGMSEREARWHVSGVVKTVAALRSAGRHFWRDPEALFREAPEG